PYACRDRGRDPRRDRVGEERRRADAEEGARGRRRLRGDGLKGTRLARSVGAPGSPDSDHLARSSGAPADAARTRPADAAASASANTGRPLALRAASTPTPYARDSTPGSIRSSTVPNAVSPSGR